MGSDLHLATLIDKVSGVVGFVGSNSFSLLSGGLREHLLGCFPLAGSGCLSDAGIHDQPISVLCEDMARVAQSGLFAFSLLGQPCIRVGCGDMGLIGSLLSVEIHLRIAPLPGARRVGGRRVILWTEALKRSPSFEQCPVNREVILGEKPFFLGF